MMSVLLIWCGPVCILTTVDRHAAWFPYWSVAITFYTIPHPSILVPSATPLWACGAAPYGGSRPSDSVLSRSEGLDHAEGAAKGFRVASSGGLFEGYGYDGPGVCLGDGQTEAEGVPSRGGRGDALLRYVPTPDLIICWFAGGPSSSGSRIHRSCRTGVADTETTILLWFWV